MDLANTVRVARGNEPAELVLRNARLINVFTAEIYQTDIIISDTRVVALGKGYNALEEIDLHGRYVCPGFIDAHVHIESSMVPPREFARAVLPHGVTTVVTDPHEIANVLGLEGIRFMLQDAKYGPLSMYVNAPSCVPATNMETSGSQLEFYDLATLLAEPWVLGLAEVMNYPGVINGDQRVLSKIQTFNGRIIDGHAPGMRGQDLNAYLAAGVMSDHECTSVEEAREKLRAGMTVFIREATTAHNLRTLLPMVTAENHRRLCFCTDDRHPQDLVEQGSIDYMVRVAIEQGLDPILAIRMGTLNTSEYFRLYDRGAIAPGRRADLIVFSDLHDLRPELVFRFGRLAARNGETLPWERPERKTKARGTINVNWQKLSFAIPAESRFTRVIGVVPDEIVTRNLVEEARIVEGLALPDVQRDIAKIAVVERHFGTGNTGLGFVKGLGLKKGAIASTVAHDHHNIVVAGMDDTSMLTAVQAIASAQGGMAVADGEDVKAILPLPIAGLMSDQPIEVVCEQNNVLQAAAHALGSSLHDPFMELGFLALSVIPTLKITDKGLIDVDKFQIVPLFVDGED
jgi:adenine deaminase